MPEIRKLKRVEQDGIHIVSVSSDTARPVSAEVAVVQWEGDPYEGPLEVTPGEEALELPTRGKTARENIVVKPIPSNYGLITWDGTVITVS